MLTISQLASYAGCTVKAVRVYHERGLLPEPQRDASGYRRYDAQAVIDLSRIVTVAKAGVPLVDIPAVLAAGDDEHRDAVARIDAELAGRISELKKRRARLALLDRPDRLCLPAPAVAYLDRLRELGMSERGVAIERDTWILAVALLPKMIEDYLPMRLAMLDDPEFVRVLLSFDDAIEWAADDPRIDELVDATVALTRRMTTAGETEGWNDLPREVLAVLTTFEGVESAGWRALNERIEKRLADEPG
ncbi:MerR family transcriptional regulator [Pseudonocardia sp. TRM90224]|uniref:MerR family transcriptional regulator n=1 Tax=Pseudonocardia sp. TRM90224 TaxID=2812678 RepID=UPI001E3C8B2C|nr:MerR family transcriptional regulator [Pseudonocardia sp. TRM90224]